MKQLLTTLRIRPPRLAFLVDYSAPASEFVRLIRFASQLWGGRYSIILLVGPDNLNALALARLRELRPDFVYGVNINVKLWKSQVAAACQPRQFCQLRPEVAENVQLAHHEGLIRCDAAIISMFETRHTKSRRQRPLVVVNSEAESPFRPYVAAMFGMHHPNLAEEFRDEQRDFRGDNVEEYLDLCLEFSKHHNQSWLDASSFGLTGHHMGGPRAEPTIVLVDHITSDLSLAWNIRLACDHSEPSWILPVPAEATSQIEVIRQVAQWMHQFDRIANYCVVTSESIAQDACKTFIETLTRELKGTSITYVDYESPRKRLPLVVACGSRMVWPATINERIVELLPPQPEFTNMLRSNEYWYIDLVHDCSTRRAILDMLLPSSSVMPAIMNGPCPPSFEYSVIKRFGDGVDSMNFRVSRSEGAVKFYVPSPEEVFEELMYEAGYTIHRDEKRSSYLPTIKRFGGLHSAALELSGQARDIIEVLRTGPMRPDEIQGRCKLGKGTISVGYSTENIANFVVTPSGRETRIARRRFREYSRGHVPEGADFAELLEHWVDKNIIERSWELGPCLECRHSWFDKELDLRRPILCANCGHRILLPKRLPLGYSLTRPVKHALEQGLIPVVLTGRFLRNLTDNGYFWVPGFKYTKDGQDGDVDIVACCDRHLVFAECKTLCNTSADGGLWNDVKEQFLTLAMVAIECKATLVVLASSAKEYPA